MAFGFVAKLSLLLWAAGEEEPVGAGRGPARVTARLSSGPAPSNATVNCLANGDAKRMCLITSALSPARYSSGDIRRAGRPDRGLSLKVRLRA